MFDIGQSVIDTNRKNSPIICAIIPESSPTIYVLKDDETNEYYMADEERLIKYDKYWFDNH